MQVKMDHLLSFNSFYMEAKEQGRKFSPLFCAQLAKIKDLIELELIRYQNSLDAITEKYAQKDEEGNYKLSEDGKSYLIIGGKEQETMAEIKALLEEEVTIHSEFYVYELSHEDEITLGEGELIARFLND